MTQATPLPDWMTAPRADDLLEVPAADADAVALFFALATQWRFHAMGGHRIGLDYSAIRPTAELSAIALSPGTMADLRLMEGAALDAFAAREARAR